MTSYGDLEPVTRRAAKAVAYQWPNLLDADDFEQEIWLRLLQSPGTVEKVLEMDDRARYRAIVGIGHQIASIERTDYDYFKGSYRYSVKEVKELLQQGILSEPLPAFKAELIDMTEAFQDIPEQYKSALVSRYVEGVTPQEKSGQNRLTRGLESLVDEMNRVQRRRHSERDDGPGTRAVLSNAQARYQADDDWDGEGESE